MFIRVFINGTSFKSVFNKEFIFNFIFASFFCEQRDYLERICELQAVYQCSWLLIRSLSCNLNNGRMVPKFAVFKPQMHFIQPEAIKNDCRPVDNSRSFHINQQQD